MYLSRITIDYLNASNYHLNGTYSWHSAIWRAFPGPERSFLYRLDQGATHQLMLLSADPPIRQKWGAWESKEIPGSFLEREAYQFSLRANPTVCRVVRDNGVRRKNGRHEPIVTPDGLAEWFDRVAARSGFQRESLHFEAPVLDVFAKPDGRKIVISRVDFTGTITIKDHEAFKAAYRSGIGQKKSFGYGLLLLKPLR